MNVEKRIQNALFIPKGFPFYRNAGISEQENKEFISIFSLYIQQMKDKHTVDSVLTILSFALKKGNTNTWKERGGGVGEREDTMKLHTYNYVEGKWVCNVNEYILNGRHVMSFVLFG